MRLAWWQRLAWWYVAWARDVFPLSAWLSEQVVAMDTAAVRGVSGAGAMSRRLAAGVLAWGIALLVAAPRLAGHPRALVALALAAGWLVALCAESGTERTIDRILARDRRARASLAGDDAREDFRSGFFAAARPMLARQHATLAALRARLTEAEAEAVLLDVRDRVMNEAAPWAAADPELDELAQRCVCADCCTGRGPRGQ